MTVGSNVTKGVIVNVTAKYWCVPLENLTLAVRPFEFLLLCLVTANLACIPLSIAERAFVPLLVSQDAVRVPIRKGMSRVINVTLVPWKVKWDSNERCISFRCFWTACMVTCSLGTLFISHGCTSSGVICCRRPLQLSRLNTCFRHRSGLGFPPLAS